MSHNSGARIIAVSDTDRRTQEQRRKTAEQALIHAAAELIAEGGSAAVTLAKVGEKAGYSRGLANHHFGSKANLMARVIDDVTDAFQAALISDSEAVTATADLRRLINVYMNAVQYPLPINRARLALFGEAITENFPYRSVIDENDRIFCTNLIQLFERGKSSGEWRSDLDSANFAITTIALLRGIACQAFTRPELDVSSAHQEIEAMLLSRLQK